MKYVIYPAIGIARLGNSSEFFIGPESEGSFGKEVAPDGSEIEVSQFKDSAFKMKKMASRFRVFRLEDDGTQNEVIASDNLAIEWDVEVANKKDAVVRPNSPPGSPQAILMDPARVNRHIQAQGSVGGANQSGTSLIGTYNNASVKLGEVRTDASGNLLFLGGDGVSASALVPSAPMGSDFYNNPDWHDDVCDGVVSAVIKIPGQDDIQAEPGYVIVAPPDFSPVSAGAVTLHDYILQAAIDFGIVDGLSTVNFKDHIEPIIRRVSSLQYVNTHPAWASISLDWARLGSKDSSNAALRDENNLLISEVESVLHDFSLMDWQLDALERWVDGDFEEGSASNLGKGEVLTKAALDQGLGQGLFPGIEAGVNISNIGLFNQVNFDFRFDITKVSPGDMTALMALPWQADFLKCSSGWWPAQRPNLVPQLNGSPRPWLRPTMNHKRLVEDVMKLGVVHDDGSGKIFEHGRDRGALGS